MMEHIVWFAKTDAPDQSAAVRELLARALGYMPRLAYGAHGSALRIRAARLSAPYRRALSALISSPARGG